MEIKTHSEMTPEKSKPCEWNVIGRKLLNLSDSFEWVNAERVGENSIITLQEAYIKTKGKAKGKKGWRGEKVRCIISFAEVEAFRVDWERINGVCWRCEGTGQEMYGITMNNERLFRQCTRCGGERRGR